MLTGMPMQFMTVHACTASHRLCPSPSWHPAQDCTPQLVVFWTLMGTCCELKAEAEEPVTRICDSQAVLWDLGATVKPR